MMEIGFFAIGPAGLIGFPTPPFVAEMGANLGSA